MNFVEELFKDTKNLNKPLVRGTSEKLKYHEAYAFIRGVSDQIKKKGYKKGEKILIYSDNSNFFIITFYAVILSGCVAVPVETKISRAYLDYIVSQCKVKCAFVQARHKRRLEKYSPKDLFAEEDIRYFKKPISKEKDLVDLKPENDLATILFTSGSTSKPKGVMISHHNLSSNTHSILKYLKLTDKDIMEMVLPFYYSYGLSILNTHVKVGGILVLNNRFMFPGTVLDDINKYGCTGFAGVPSTFQILLRKSKIKRVELPTLRYVTQAGGKLGINYIEELIETIPNTEIYIMYGQTEATARLSYLAPELLTEKTGSVGKGIPGVDGLF
jgi:acyl-CoA synthetase (AMP-forming)/AMP-acid ligase II